MAAEGCHQNTLDNRPLHNRFARNRHEAGRKGRDPRPHHPFDDIISGGEKESYNDGQIKGGFRVVGGTVLYINYKTEGAAIKHGATGADFKSRLIIGGFTGVQNRHI